MKQHLFPSFQEPPSLFAPLPVHRFNVADHFGSATNEALECQQSVFEDLAKADLWEKDLADGAKLRKLQARHQQTIYTTRMHAVSFLCVVQAAASFRHSDK